MTKFNDTFQGRYREDPRPKRQERSERKQGTVMFRDMEGFTALTEKLGPEEAYGIMDKIYEILIHRNHDSKGTVNEMTGAGIMALFGAPTKFDSKNIWA
jgi:class 3 adenylate cyclase